MNDHDAALAVAEYIRGSSNPDMRQYGHKVANNPHAFIREIHRELRELGIAGGRVLDVGAGFAWHAFAMSLLARSEVVANDVRSMMTDEIDRRVAEMKAEGVEANVKGWCADICTSEIPSDHFDAILCNQTLEHVHDQEGMFRAFAKCLKKGGRFLITNTNNALNREVFRESVEMWHKRDESQEYIDSIRSLRPVEFANDEPFAKTRRTYITHAEPSIAGADLEKLVHATAGLTKGDIEQAARAFRASGALPARPELNWCRNPETGEYVERLLEPYEIAGKLRALGLRASVVHRYRRFPLNLLNNLPGRALNVMMFQLRPGFGILGEKL